MFPTFTQSTVSILKANGAPIDEKTYPGVDHGGIVTAARANAAAWIKSRLR